MADFRNIPKGTEPDWYWHVNGIVQFLKEDPWKVYVPPYRLGPHIWNVSGNPDNGAYLIDTGDGLIMVDAPYYYGLELQLKAIEEAGYDLKDIKYIWITHPHGDHFGAAVPLAERTGAKIWMSREGEAWWGRRKAAGVMRPSDGGYDDFPIDFYYDDYNPFTMGNMTFRFEFHPGHCEGSMVMFFEDTDPDTGKTYKVGMHGGIGTCNSKWVEREGSPLWHYYRYIADNLQMAEMDDIDITLPNHENQTNMHTGINLNDRRDYSAFVNRDVWKNLMIQKSELAIKEG